MDKKSLNENKVINNMDLIELLNDVKNINPDEFKCQENKDVIDLYFISKCDECKYSAYSPSISKDIQKKIQQIAVNKILKLIELVDKKGYTQDEYNAAGQLDGVIEICDKKFIKNLDKLTSSLEEKNQLEKMMEVDNIHTYCFEFKHKDNRVLVFRRFTKMRKLREGFLGIFTDGTFGKIEGEILGVDNDIDLVLYEDKILILNHIALERIFSLEDQFKSEARATIDMIESKGIILNFEKFEKDVLNNIPAVKRLTKIGSKTLPLFFENFDKVVQVSKAFGLGITFNDDESKINYEDKSQIAEITLLMNDAYYKTLIGNQKGMDKLK